MSTQNQNQLTPALAFELFTELKSRSDASRWQKAVEGVSNLSMKVYGQLPTFQVIDGSAAYKATIFDSKRWSCACTDFTNRLQKKGAACRHLGAVALLSFLPLASQNARERGASPLADELEACGRPLPKRKPRSKKRPSDRRFRKSPSQQIQYHHQIHSSHPRSKREKPRVRNKQSQK